MVGRWKIGGDKPNKTICMSYLTEKKPKEASTSLPIGKGGPALAKACLR